MPAERILFGVAEDLLGAAIEVDDAQRLIDGDDGVRGDGQNARELGLRRAKLILDPMLRAQAPAQIGGLRDDERRRGERDQDRGEQAYTSASNPSLSASCT
ncbi:MAG TPA: hypothetical protein VN706_16975 [Gemmatimonadaceae bacterium]|nr:hypothetical protein [Gemmatimonadaceae bacterium]